MTDYCSVCGKKLGLLSFKYKSEDGSVMCSSCLKEHKMKQDELKRQEEQRKQEQLRKKEGKNREIMLDYISKYLANKDVKNLGYILRFCDVDYSDWTVDIEEWKVDWEGDYELLLVDAEESSKKRGLSSSELDVISRTIKMCEKSLDFLDDFEKMYELFKKKGIETDYSEILSNFSEEIREILNKEGYAIMELSYDSTVLLDSHWYYIYEAFDLKPIYEAISTKLGTNITEENVIKEFIKLVPEIGNRGTEHAEMINIEEIVSTLLDKFNLTYEEDEIEKLIEKIVEEIELEEFEQNLGAAPRKQKIEVGDFTQLNGYEFEEYLKNLFELLDYTAVQTPSSGDQGADLILSKDDEKIVVQAKKYDGKVSNKAVQEIVAAKNYYEADRVMIVTNSSFTKSAIELAFSNDVELWDGRKLKNVIEDLEKGKR